jgi:hypothetical protein
MDARSVQSSSTFAGFGPEVNDPGACFVVQGKPRGARRVTLTRMKEDES